MEYDKDSNLVVDPARTEKTFTASQIIKAMMVAHEKVANEVRETLLAGGMPPSILITSEIQIAAVTVMSEVAIEEALGITGKDGGYI